MNKARLAVLFLLIGVGALAFMAQAADLVGGWNGTSKKNYVTFYGNRDGMFGQYPMAVLELYNATTLNDTTGNDSTGTFKLADWMSSLCTFKWMITDTGTATTPLMDVIWQVKYDDGDTWYDAKFLADCTNVETWQIDTLDFTDPAMNAPYHRLFWDGQPGNAQGGITAYGYLKFVKSDYDE